MSDSDDGALPVGVRGGVSSRSAPCLASAGREGGHVFQTVKTSPIHFETFETLQFAFLLRNFKKAEIISRIMYGIGVKIQPAGQDKITTRAGLLVLYGT